MRSPLSFVLAMFCALASCPACAAPVATPQAAKAMEIDAAIEAAIENGDCPGAVVLIGHKGETVYRKAYGHRAVQPEREAMTADTIFDLASLTKPIATAPCVMLLIERGKVKLDDPIAKHMPEFAAEGKEKITVEDLLRHRGGLIADNHLRDYADGATQAWANICKLKPVAAPGEKFIYSDVGFIVLGQLVERVEGKRLKHMASESVFGPLGMKDTMFSPPPQLWKRCAPTQQRDGQWMRGVVHDPRAWALEGNAGHAGLFGTADDLAKFAWMLLRQGALNRKRVMGADTVREMVRGKPLADGKSSRGLGWDVDTAYSSPRGDHFQRGVSFGHTGFTGTSLWIDPASDTFVILLTNRVHPDGKGNTTPLRRRVATLAAESLGVR